MGTYGRGDVFWRFGIDVFRGRGDVVATRFGDEFLGVYSHFDDGEDAAAFEANWNRPLGAEVDGDLIGLVVDGRGVLG